MLSIKQENNKKNNVGGNNVRRSGHVEGETMIKLDLDALSEHQLREVVSARCAEYGSVSTVTIIKHDHRYNFALAAVEMSRPEETFAVLKAFGDSKVDNMAVIRIEQEEKKN
jgi:hypothetical protein